VSTDAVLIVGVGIVLVLPLAWRAVAGRFDPFEPIVVFAVAWGVMFVVRPSAILIRGDTTFFGVDIEPTLDRALLLALLGAVAFVIGYEGSVGTRVAARLPTPPAAVRTSVVLACAFAVSALGVLALAAFLLSAGGIQAVGTFFGGRSDALNDLFDNSTNYLWWASLLVVPAALLSFAVGLVDRRPATAVAAALLVGAALLRTVPVGNRLFLLVLIGGMVVLVYLHRRKRPGAVALIVACVLGLVVSTALQNLRYAENRDSFSSFAESVMSSPSRIVSPLINGADAEMAPALAGALQAVPDELPHRYGGATIGDLVRRPIPRELWEGKPETPGHELVAAVWPEARERGGFDPALTPLLYFYWDFGLPGVFVGMAFYGFLARALYQYARTHEGNLFAQVLFALGLPLLVIAARNDPVSGIMTAAVLFVPLAVTAWAAARASRSEFSSRNC
jgi:hypothetical protein